MVIRQTPPAADAVGDEEVGCSILTRSIIVHRSEQFPDVFLLPLFEQEWFVRQFTFDVRTYALNEIDDSVGFLFVVIH